MLAGGRGRRHVSWSMSRGCRDHGRTGLDEVVDVGVGSDEEL